MNIIGQVKTGIVMADFHSPYQDKKLIKLVSEFIKEFKPGEIVLDGDILNYAAYGSHGKRKNETPYEEVNEDHVAANLMLDELLPNRKTELIWLDGNHDKWQDDYFTENPNFFDDSIHRYSKLQLKKRGFGMILPYKGFYKAGKLNVTHGFRAGVTAVRSHLIQDFHANFVMGHIHKSDTATSGNIEGKVMQGYSVGCMCKRDWNYSMFKNSNQGFGIYFVQRNGNFSFYNVVVIDNAFAFDGHLWKL
jgi:predicted phosphodiesterase